MFIASEAAFEGPQRCNYGIGVYAGLSTGGIGARRIIEVIDCRKVYSYSALSAVYPAENGSASEQIALYERNYCILRFMP